MKLPVKMKREIGPRWRAQLSAYMKKTKLGSKPAARSADLNEQAFNDWLNPDGNDRMPTLDKAAAVASVAGFSLDEVAGLKPSTNAKFDSEAFEIALSAFLTVNDLSDEQMPPAEMASAVMKWVPAVRTMLDEGTIAPNNYHQLFPIFMTAYDLGSKSHTAE